MAGSRMAWASLATTVGVYQVCSETVFSGGALNDRGSQDWAPSASSGHGVPVSMSG
jgi:hypothetical protein